MGFLIRDKCFLLPAAISYFGASHFFFNPSQDEDITGTESKQIRQTQCHGGMWNSHMFHYSFASVFECYGLLSFRFFLTCCCKTELWQYFLNVTAQLCENMWMLHLWFSLVKDLFNVILSSFWKTKCNRDISKSWKNTKKVNPQTRRTKILNNIYSYSLCEAE